MSAKLGQWTAPADEAFAVTPSDSTIIPTAAGFVPRGLYVGVAGDLTVDMQTTGVGILFKAVPVGVFPWAVKRVWSTGTTATNIVAIG